MVHTLSPVASVSLSPNDKAMVSDHRDAIDMDLANLPDLRAFSGLPRLEDFRFQDLWISPFNSCVTTKETTNPDGSKDILYTFDCKRVTGTSEIIVKKDASGKNFERHEDLKFASANGDVRQIKSDDQVNRTTATGVISVAKSFDEFRTKGVDAIENKGNSTYIYTPDDATRPMKGGKVQIGRMFQSIKNGVVEKTVTVSSKDLHRSSCGMDSGSIEFVFPQHDVVVTFTGCGQRSITDNGQPVGP